MQMKKSQLVPSDRILRKMGLSADQDGIIRRYLDEGSNWNSHLDNTKEFILECVSKPEIESIGILGSGWLLDVPIEELATRFKKVALFDIRHPRQIEHKLRRFKNVEFHKIDLTGGCIEEVYYLIRKAKQNEAASLTQLEYSRLALPENIDYFCSVNLLSQLDILILEYMRKFDYFPETDIKTFRKKIQSNHMASLPRGRSCLICDYEEKLFDRTGQIVKMAPLVLVDLPKGSRTKNWTWKFDSHMNFYPNRTTDFNVTAIEL